MKNLIFYGPRVLATVVFIILLSFLGIGNPQVVPFYALFFTVVFAAIFFLNKIAKESERAAKSGAVMLPVMQIGSLVIFIGILSILGFIHGIIGYLIWFILVSLVCGAILMLIKNRQRHFELIPENPKLKHISSAVLAFMAILLPMLIIRFGGVMPAAGGVGILAIILSLLGVLLFILMMGFALVMINKWGNVSMYRILGYTLIVLATLLPGIMVMLISRTSIAFAGAYMASLIALALTYFALDMRIQIS